MIGRWWLRRLHRRAVSDTLAEGHSLLDRVDRGDPGAPTRVLVPHVVGLASCAIRQGTALQRQGILRQQDHAATLGALHELLLRADKHGG